MDDSTAVTSKSRKAVGGRGRKEEKSWCAVEGPTTSPHLSLTSDQFAPRPVHRNRHSSRAKGIVRAREPFCERTTPHISPPGMEIVMGLRFLPGRSKLKRTTPPVNNDRVACLDGATVVTSPSPVTFLLDNLNPGTLVRRERSWELTYTIGSLFTY